jgi:hypothetical protein
MNRTSGRFTGRGWTRGLGAALCVLFAASARGGTTSVEIEGGGAWFSRNDVRIPGDDGTEFDMLDLTGPGPDLYARLCLSHAFNDRHLIRLTAAPLEVEGDGRLSDPTRFAGEEFAPDVTTRGTYRFNTFRLTYRRTFRPEDGWEWGVGGALLVRDAEIQLEQGPLSASDSNVGVVPLLHLYASRPLTGQLAAAADFEGLASPQGRALDLALTLRYRPHRDWDVAAGYRTLEGGADNDSVYTFAWIHYAMLSVTRRF